MDRSSRLLLYWSPRVLGVAVVLFLSLFALDAFQEGLGPWRAALAFLIHLAPAALVAAVLALAWRWEWLGAALFAVAATLYATRMLPRNPIAVLLISGPLVLLAALFLVGWLKRSELKISHE